MLMIRPFDNLGAVACGWEPSRPGFDSLVDDGRACAPTLATSAANDELVTRRPLSATRSSNDKGVPLASDQRFRRFCTRFVRVAWEPEGQGFESLGFTNCWSEAPVTPPLPTAAGAFARLDRPGAE